MRDFRRLAVWEKAPQLTLAVYAATASFPRAEAYGLTGQMRRSAASIPANIAEGCGREGQAELARFMRVAMGSASELEYHLLLAHDLEVIQDRDYQALEQGGSEVKRMLTAFVQRLKADG